MIIDRCHILDTKTLNEYGCLDRGIHQGILITWYRNGEKGSEISVITNTKDEYDYHIVLDYKYQDEEVSYKIPIEYLPSNLGKGYVPFLVCPRTHLRCRKLYRYSKHFLHRKAYINPIYDCQTESSKWRGIISYREYKKAYDEINSPYFTRYYNGKKTKRYQKLLDLISRYENDSLPRFERMVVGLCKHL